MITLTKLEAEYILDVLEQCAEYEDSYGFDLHDGVLNAKEIMEAIIRTRVEDVEIPDGKTDIFY